MEKPYHCLRQGYSFLLHPPAACLGSLGMSLGLVMLMKSNQCMLLTGLSGKPPLVQLFMCPRICPFFLSICCLYYFLQLQNSNAVFPQVASAFPAENAVAGALVWHMEAGAERVHFQMSPWHRTMPVSHSPEPQFLHLKNGHSIGREVLCRNLREATSSSLAGTNNVHSTLASRVPYQMSGQN